MAAAKAIPAAVLSPTTTLPEATVSGSIACDTPGSNGWCRGAAVLNLSGSEPLDSYSILALEGTHNGVTFACSGAACQLSLAEGANDFTFWAVSSYGDTSNMGSASAGLDTQPPVISGQITGTAGQNGWYVSAVSVDASASDSGSGLSVLEFSINGASWSAWSGALSLGDGVHNLALRATDVAGNSSSENLTLSMDTQLPELVLNSAASFCPNCGELLDIQIQTSDALSGVNSWELRSGSTIITSGSTATDQSFSWNGSGLPGGVHTLVLQVLDAAGNTSSTTHDVTLILPAVVPPKRSVATATPRPMIISHTPTPSGTSTPTYAAESVFALSLPTPTRIAVSIPFGGRPSIPVTGSEGNTPGALPGQDPQSGTNACTTTTNPVLWGGSAAALVAAAMAVGAAERRRRKVKAQRLAQEMARRNSAAEAREQAQALAEAEARRAREELEAQKAAQWKSRAEAFRQDEELIESLKSRTRTPAGTSPAEQMPHTFTQPQSNLRTATSAPAPPGQDARSTPQPEGHTPDSTGTPTPPGFNIPGMTRAQAPPGQEPLRDPDLWQRITDWGREKIENLVMLPPALISLSYNWEMPHNSMRNLFVDEWVSYQPQTRDKIESISYQSVTLDHIQKSKITSNPSGRIDFNFANFRFTFKGNPNADDSRVDWFIQPVSLSAGSRSVGYPESTDAGTLRQISMSTYDIDILGPNWFSLKVSQAYGRSYSTLFHLEPGEFQMSDTRLTEVGMKVIRYPRLVAAGVLLVLTYNTLIALAPVVIPVLPTLLEKWPQAFGIR